MDGVWVAVESIIAGMKEARVPEDEIDPFFIIAEAKYNPEAVAAEIRSFLDGMAEVGPLSRESEAGALRNFLEVRFPCSIPSWADPWHSTSHMISGCALVCAHRSHALTQLSTLIRRVIRMICRRLKKRCCGVFVKPKAHLLRTASGLST